MSPQKTKKKTAKQAPELPEFALPGFASGESLSEFERAGLAADFISSRSPLKPEIALVLGSGLGAFADEFTSATKIPYAEIPYFPRSTAIGHAGKLVVGKVGKIPVCGG